MGFKTTSEKILLLTRSNESIEISSKEDSSKETKYEILTLEKFLCIFRDSPLNGFSLKLDNISTLDLSHCQLTDLPTSCQSLKLKHLSLSHNKFATVPICIYNGLENLEYLDFGHNAIEQFNMQPACLTRIKVVKINNNLLPNLPKWILNFQSTNLEELNFSYNKSTNYQYPKNSYNMNIMKLKKLKLKNSHLIDNDFNFIKCFQSLEYLDISNKGRKYVNNFYETDNLFVKLKWKQLRVLKMNNLSISLFPEGIAWVETLTELHIHQNSISWLPDGIEFMVNLQILDISQNTLIAIPEQLGKLELLEVLLANQNAIETCPDFSAMTSLKVLDLYDNLLETVSLNCDTIEELDLEYNYMDTGDIDSAYQMKKTNLRMHQLKDHSRSDGRKFEDNYYDDPLRNYTSDDYSDEEEQQRIVHDQTPTKTIIDENEDWDSPAPARVTEKNPEIDSADEEWDGEECVGINRSTKVRIKIYVEDEDWMFEDADETP